MQRPADPDEPPKDLKPTDLAQIAAEAAEHFARTVNRKPTKADRQALAEWLATDPRHAKAYDNLERIWQGASELPELKTRKRKPKRTVSRRDLGVGALALVAGAGAWRYFSDYPFADYRTGAGERRTVTLADGSRVDLAAETRLSVSIDAARRRIVLHDGEAFFQVARDPRPFAVEAGEGVTTALGTAFSVEYRNDTARVLVTEHAVNVKVDAQSANIAAGSQIQYAARQLGVAEKADSEAALGWRDGWLVFNGKPLGEVVETLNRWRGGRIVVLSPDLAKRQITLIVDLDRLDVLPDQLAKALPVRLIQMTPLLIVIVPA